MRFICQPNTLTRDVWKSKRTDVLSMSIHSTCKSDRVVRNLHGLLTFNVVGASSALGIADVTRTWYESLWARNKSKHGPYLIERSGL